MERSRLGCEYSGIVTRLDLPTFPQGKMRGGSLFYDSSAYPQLIRAFHDFTASTHADESAHIIAGTCFGGGREVSVSISFTRNPSLRCLRWRPSWLCSHKYSIHSVRTHCSVLRKSSQALAPMAHVSYISRRAFASACNSCLTSASCG